MKFSKERPPVMDKLEKAFGVKWGGDVCVAYNDTIYHSKPLHPSVIVHENVHLKRQGKDSDAWYESYIRDNKFRFGEELLAYRMQYQYLKETMKDRNELARHWFRLAKDLSSPMYGSVISHREAMKLIKME